MELYNRIKQKLDTFYLDGDASKMEYKRTHLTEISVIIIISLCTFFCSYLITVVLSAEWNPANWSLIRRSLIEGGLRIFVVLTILHIEESSSRKWLNRWAFLLFFFYLYAYFSFCVYSFNPFSEVLAMMEALFYLTAYQLIHKGINYCITKKRAVNTG